MRFIFLLLLGFSLPINAMHRLTKNCHTKSAKQRKVKSASFWHGNNWYKTHYPRGESDDVSKNIDTSRAGLMVCTPPGISAEHLADFSSLDDVNTYLRKRNHELDCERKKVRNWTQGKFDAQLKWRQKIKTCLNLHYKVGCNSAVHDECLAPFIREETKRILNLAKINPESVSMVGNIPETGPFATASAPPVGIEDGGYFYAAGPARLRFNVTRLKDKDYRFLVFLIAREIGHLLNHHSYALEEKPYSYTNREQITALNNLHHETNVLQDLEANVTVALLNKHIAHTIRQYLLSELAKPHTAAGEPTNIKMASESEQSINDLYLWMTKIVELHEKKSS